MGYKFYETAAVRGIIDYDQTVQYPFGYGLGYTTFEQKMGEIKESGKTISVDVTVTNTGRRPVRTWWSSTLILPTRTAALKRRRQNLLQFAKTDLLQPGQSQTLTLSFAAEDLASYDYQTNKAYVLEAGDYILSVNSDSHNILDRREYHVSQTVVYAREKSGILTRPRRLMYLTRRRRCGLSF